jgi:hypothetical protein
VLAGLAISKTTTLVAITETTVHTIHHQLFFLFAFARAIIIDMLVHQIGKIKSSSHERLVGSDLGKRMIFDHDNLVDFG